MIPFKAFKFTFIIFYFVTNFTNFTCIGLPQLVPQCFTCFISILWPHIAYSYFTLYSHSVHLPNLSITSMVSTTIEIQCIPVHVSCISPMICKKNFHYLPFSQYCQYLQYFQYFQYLWYFQYFQSYCTIFHFLCTHLHTHFYLGSDPVFIIIFQV